MTLSAPALSDEDLASTAQQGNHQAFETLVGRHKELLYRLARHYVGNSDDAYDLLQETFMSTWENLHRYDPKRSFIAWARTIMLNKCRDYSRRRRFRGWIEQLFAAEPSNEPLSPEIEAELREMNCQEGHRLRRLEEAIAELPALYKEPLLLTMIGGLSQQATATALKTTTKAIEMRLRRARHHLSKILDAPREDHARSLPTKRIAR